MRWGYVYVAKRGDLHKIGASQNLARRMAALRAKLVAQVGPVEMFQLEKALHRRFAAKHAHGEWFRLTEEDVQWISSTNPAIIIREDNRPVSLGASINRYLRARLDDYVATTGTTVRAVVEGALKKYLAAEGFWPRKSEKK